MIRFIESDSEKIAGVIDSCLDRFFDESCLKNDIYGIGFQVCGSRSMHNYWIHSEIWTYIKVIFFPKIKKILAVTFSTGHIGRQCFYRKCLIDPKDITSTVLQSSLAYRFIHRLMKVNCGIHWYLITRLSRDYTWWVLYKHYDVINGLFKNLCEGNFKEMKILIGQ
jgi:hypothetical protein